MSLGNIMNRSNPGERYLMGDLMGPDARFQDDVGVIEAGVRQLEQEHSDNPFLKEKVADYDRYRDSLGWFEYYVKPNETFDGISEHYRRITECLPRSSDQFGSVWDDSDGSILSTIGNTLKRAEGFVINRSVSGNYYKGTPWGPDGRFVDELAAIDNYVRTQARPAIAQHPGSIGAVQDYEKWRQSFAMGSPETDLYPDSTMNTAKAKLFAIKSAQGQAPSPTSVAKPGEFNTPPEDSSKLMPQLKTAGKIVGVVGGVILLLLGVRAVKRGAGRAVIAGVKTLGSGIASGTKNLTTKLLPQKIDNR